MSMGRIDHGRIVHSANRPWGESSMGRIVQRLGETYSGRNVWKPCDVKGEGPGSDIVGACAHDLNVEPHRRFKGMAGQALTFAEG